MLDRTMFCLLLACACLPAWAAAQDPDSLVALRRAVTATKPFTAVRVQLQDTRLVTGPLAGFSATGLDLGSARGSVVHIPFLDVTRYWERRRAIRPGAITGGILGGGVGAFFGLVATALCEYECDTSLAGGAVIGGLLVGGMGALAGAAVGAAIPRWSLRWRLGSRARAETAGRVAPVGVTTTVPATGTPLGARQTGELVLQLVGAYGGSAGDQEAYYPVPEEQGGMFGASASLGFRYKRVAFGPEAIWLLGTPGVFAVNGLARADLGSVDSRRMPYAVAGIGGYYWQGDASAGGFWLQVSFGAGLAFGDGHNWRVEGRWHPVIQNTGNNYKPSMFTLGGGRRFGW